MDNAVSRDDAIARRMRFQQATPFAQAIGLELRSWEAGSATTRLAPSGAVRRSAASDAIHPWALIGMADHTLSYVFPGVLPPEAGLSTLNLRLDFGAAPVGDVTATARLHHRAADHGTALLSATGAAGAPVLAATALFNFRSFPGGGKLRRPDLPPFESDNFGPFADFLGLNETADSLWLEGGGRRTVGFEGLPALHGGVIGALLAEACQAACARAGLSRAMRLTTLHISFLRPAGLARLDAQADIVRAGRSAAFLTARCWHRHDEPVAEARATFAPESD